MINIQLITNIKSRIRQFNFRIQFFGTNNWFLCEHFDFNTTLDTQKL